MHILSNLSEEDKELPPEELQCRIECERRIKSLRLVTEELGKQVQQRPFSMEELKQAQAQHVFFDY